MEPRITAKAVLTASGLILAGMATAHLAIKAIGWAGQSAATAMAKK